MRILLLLLSLALTGCDAMAQPPPKEWRCFGGLTYEHDNGAWVLIDGHPLIGFKDGPIKCAESSEQHRGNHDV